MATKQFSVVPGDDTYEELSFKSEAVLNVMVAMEADGIPSGLILAAVNTRAVMEGMIAHPDGPEMAWKEFSENMLKSIMDSVAETRKHGN